LKHRKNFRDEQSYETWLIKGDTYLAADPDCRALG